MGGFIAKISKGRSVREFIWGGVFVPTMASVIWFSVMGTLGIDLGQNGILQIEQINAIASNPELGLFEVLFYYPMGKIISGIVIILLICFL